jgi:ribosomal protein S18 acetylase RimI-like enzyme
MRDDAGDDDGAVTPGPEPSPIMVARDGTKLDVIRFAERSIAALQRFNAGLSERTRSVFLPHAYDDKTLAGYAARGRSGQDRSYVLCSGQVVVGYFFLWEFDQPVPILGIGLADAWQGMRLGEPMIRLLISDARAAKREAIELTTVPSNQRALHLYRRLGFDEIGETDNIAGDGRVVRERRLFMPLIPGAQPPERTFKPPGYEND